MSPAMNESHPHLAWETSINSTHPTESDCLPEEVATCLQNARFLHLATCTQNNPHVSLMNYTYLPPHTRPPPNNASINSHPSSSSTRLPRGPTIIMTSNPSSKKTINLQENPNVSLLVHDWVSSRPPNVASDTSPARNRDRSPGAGRASSLANMLMQMNSAAVSSISATINGEAHVLEPGTEEEKWCKEQHLLNNTFSNQDDIVSSAPARNVARPMAQQQRALSITDVGSHGAFGASPSDGRAGDGGRGSYIEDEEARVVVVRIKDGRISDWKGGVKDWVIREAAEQVDGQVVDGIV